MKDTLAILCMSGVIVYGLMFLAMAIGGLKTGKVYYVSTSPPILFKVNPTRYIICTVCLLGMSAALLSGAVIIFKTLTGSI